MSATERMLLKKLKEDRAKKELEQQQTQQASKKIKTEKEQPEKSISSTDSLPNSFFAKSALDEEYNLFKNEILQENVQESRPKVDAIDENETTNQEGMKSLKEKQEEAAHEYVNLENENSEIYIKKLSDLKARIITRTETITIKRKTPKRSIKLAFEDENDIP